MEKFRRSLWAEFEEAEGLAKALRDQYAACDPGSNGARQVLDLVVKVLIKAETTDATLANMTQEELEAAGKDLLDELDD